MGQYYTGGMPAITGAGLGAGTQLGQGARIPVDAVPGNGTSQPQSGAIMPGQQILANAGATATAGGTKAAALQLGYGLNELSTVATNGDSVLLPYAFPGAVVIVSNDGAANAQVFGRGTDTIDAVATATGVVQSAAKRTIYLGVSGNGDGSNAGAWVSLAGAKT